MRWMESLLQLFVQLTLAGVCAVICYQPSVLLFAVSKVKSAFGFALALLVRQLQCKNLASR